MGDIPIKAYSISESILLEYMLLPESDEMAMPPKVSLVRVQKKFLNLCIGLQMEPKVLLKTNLHKLLKEAKAKEYADFEQLFNCGIILLPMTQDSELLHLDFQNMNGQLTETALNILAKYKDRICEIKLNRSTDTNAHAILEVLRNAKKLEKLNLSNLLSSDSITRNH